MIVFILGTQSAFGAPVAGGIQAAVYPEGIEAVRDVLADEVYEVDIAHVEAAFGCYDAVGVYNLNLDIPVEDVVVDLEGGTVNLTVHFGRVTGADMTVYGRDGDYTDACPEFDGDLEYLTLDGGMLTTSFEATVQQGVLDLAFIQQPRFTGDLDTDVAWFPDDMALALFESLLLEVIGESVGEVLPDVVASLSGDALQFGEYGDFLVDIALGEVTVVPSKLGMAATTDFAWMGNATCIPDGVADQPLDLGRTPKFDFSDVPGSSLAVGVTESMLRSLLGTAWQQGFFCADEEGGAPDLLASVAPAFDPSVGGIRASAAVRDIPQITIDEDGIRLEITGLEADVAGTYEGQPAEVLHLDADVRMVLDVAVDPDLTAFTLTAHEVELDIRELSAQHLLGGEDSAAHLVFFLETWASGWASQKAEDLVLFSSLYHVWEFVVRLDSIVYEPGGLMLYSTLYASDDPIVDSDAPDTSVTAWPTETGARVRWSGVDNGDEALAYSYRVDGGPWSAWTADVGVDLEGLIHGAHKIEVISRDSWLNVDEAPALASFVTGQSEGSGVGCGCASTHRTGPLWALGWVVLFLGRRQKAWSKRR